MGRPRAIHYAAALALSLAALAGCDRPQWQGWVYPNKSDLTDDIPLGAFNTRVACRISANRVLRRTAERRDENGDPIIGDYKCGYKCKGDTDTGLNVCESTER